MMTEMNRKMKTYNTETAGNRRVLITADRKAVSEISGKNDGKTLSYIPIRRGEMGLLPEKAIPGGVNVYGREDRLHRIREDRKRRRKAARIRLTAVIGLLVLTMFMTLSGFSAPQNLSVTEKCYKSVVVGRGDTLWSIASDNLSGDYTVKSLIREIEKLNHTGSQIRYGQLIMVPYYPEAGEETKRILLQS